MTLKSIDKTYIIETVNKQTIDYQTDEISEKANGTYQQIGCKSYIIYKTYAEGEESSTMVIADTKGVTIRRRGSVESNMVFLEGEETSSLYIMPYGKMVIRIKTQKVSVSLDSNGGKIHLKYILIIQGEEYCNDMTIKVIGE